MYKNINMNHTRFVKYQLSRNADYEKAMAQLGAEAPKKKGEKKKKKKKEVYCDLLRQEVCRIRYFCHYFFILILFKKTNTCQTCNRGGK